MYYKHILMIYSLTLVEDRFQSNYIKIKILFIHHRQFQQSPESPLVSELSRSTACSRQRRQQTFKKRKVAIHCNIFCSVPIQI